MDIDKRNQYDLTSKRMNSFLFYLLIRKPFYLHFISSFLSYVSYPLMRELCLGQTSYEYLIICVLYSALKLINMNNIEISHLFAFYLALVMLILSNQLMQI